MSKTLLILLTLLSTGCLSREFNSEDKSTLLTVPPGGYTPDRVLLPADEIISAVQRAAPSANFGKTSHYVRGWLTCTMELSGQGSCYIQVGQETAIIGNGTVVLNSLKKRFPTPRNEYGNPIYQWKITVPFESRMQLSNGEEPTQLIDFGSSDLSDEPSEKSKVIEPTFVVYAIMGLRVEPQSVIPTMLKLKAKAKITKAFLEANLICKKDSCILETETEGASDGAPVSEQLANSGALLKGIATEWIPAYGQSNSNALFHSRLRLYEEIENLSETTKSKPPKRATVALATFYKLEAVDE